jgi:hypothetical protein
VRRGKLELIPKHLQIITLDIFIKNFDHGRIFCKQLPTRIGNRAFGIKKLLQTIVDAAVFE